MHRRRLLKSQGGSDIRACSLIRRIQEGSALLCATAAELELVMIAFGQLWLWLTDTGGSRARRPFAADCVVKRRASIARSGTSLAGLIMGDPAVQVTASSAVVTPARGRNKEWP